MGKYIIELDDATFAELTKYGEPLPAGNTFHDSVLKAVANGKLCSESTGDSINREAVKDFINEVCFSKEWAKYRADYGSRGQIECILTYIDNAPPLRIPTLDDLQGEYEKGIDVGYDLAKEMLARQKGEWVCGEDDCGQDGWFCSKCNFFVPWYYTYYENDINFIRDYKVCPHCTAEMISYTGKDRDNVQKDPGDSK